MINNKQAAFLAEVAAELIAKQITNPTPEQIEDAMAARINRQGELYERLFGCSYRGQVANGTREFIANMAAEVYLEVRR